MRWDLRRVKKEGCAALAILVVAGISALPARGAESDWPYEETLHFVVHHERMGEPLAEETRVEQIYDGLQPALGSLVPWMTSEKAHLYLYKDAAAYRAGRFAPPAWSGGLAALGGDEKAVAVFEPMDARTVAHELTHLYLHAFFAEKRSAPPAWLDEGLATMLQDAALAPPDSRAKGPVLRAWMPVARLVSSRPAADAPAGWVGLWYQQSASLVWFLRTDHPPADFDDLCRALRDGEPLESSLSKLYGYDDLAALEQAWIRWRPRKPVGQLTDLNDQP